MDIGRRLRPELSDEELRLRLDAAAGPPPEPPETLLETLHLHSVKYAPTSPTVTDPTQKIRVRQRWQNFSKTPEYFDPDVERLFSIDNEAEAEPPAAAPVADTTSAAAAITAVEPPEATADSSHQRRNMDSKTWLTAEVARRRAAGDIPRGRGALTQFARQLAKEMDKAVRTGWVTRALKARRIETVLHQCLLW